MSAALPNALLASGVTPKATAVPSDRTSAPGKCSCSMNPLVMVAVALVIAAEKLLPRPELIARLLGVAAIVAGLTVIA